jgi:afadin
MSEDLQFAAPQSRGSYETTFDADGNVETTSTTSRDEKMSKKSDETNGSIPRQFTANGSVMRDNSQPMQNSMSSLRKGSDPILPAILELWEEKEDHFLNMIINRIDPNHIQFKLSVTYTSESLHSTLKSVKLLKVYLFFLK